MFWVADGKSITLLDAVSAQNGVRGESHGRT